MTSITLFVQVHGEADIRDVELAGTPSANAIDRALAAAGITLKGDDLVFHDEADEPLERGGKDKPIMLENGARIHISRCRKIAVTVHFLDETETRAFAPGTRLRKVKAWAIKRFGLDKDDAAEHVLQLCGSTRRPAGDTPLNELTVGRACELCFDLVPEQRVEG